MKSCFIILLAAMVSFGILFAKHDPRTVNAPALDGSGPIPVENVLSPKPQHGGIEVSLGNELFIETAANYLLAQQVAGGFPWTAGGGVFSNTQGTTARGMLLAYLLTQDEAYLNSAIANGNWYLINVATYPDGDPRFDTHTPNFLEQLSAVTGDPQYANFVQTWFWDKLTSGTYGANNDLDAADFGALVVTARAGQGYVALSPWDLSATVIAAHIAGETAIRDALMTYGVLNGLESTTASDYYYDVLGLAGAIWASGVTGIDLNPTAGRYAAASSTADLVTELLSLTLTSNPGAWLWSSVADDTDPTNADLQATAFAIMALNAYDRATYLDRIAAGAAFIRSLEESSGEFLSYPTAPPGSIGGVEAHGEALTAICTVAPSDTYVDDDWAGATLGDVVGGDKVFGFDGFSTVAGGIDGVASSTVHLAPGTYVEQVEIDKNLTLIGAGSSTIIKSPAVLSKFFTTAAANYPIIWAHDASNIIIRDLVVDGAGLGNANYRFVGVGYDNAGGMVDNLEIKGIRNTPIDGSQHGVGIFAYAQEGTARSLEIKNCNIYGFQKNGMTLSGADLTATASNNTVTGAGAVNFIAQNGIQLSFGATGSILGNTVSGVSYTPFTFVSTGILIYLPSGLIATEGNDVLEAQVGIYYIYAEGSIADNEYTGSLAGIGTPFWGIVVDPGDIPNLVPSPFDAPQGLSKGGAPPAGIRSLTTSVENNTLTGDGSNGVGLEMDALGSETLNVTATANTIQEFDYGVVLYKDDNASLTATLLDNTIANNASVGVEAYYTSTAGSVIEAHGNCIFGNGIFGLHTFAPPVNATGNWWGDPGGPYHASNPSGTGNPVSDFVAFNPWSTVQLPACGGVVLPPYTLLANDDVKLYGMKDSEGDVHANESVEFYTGISKTLTGEVSAVEYVEIAKKNKIVGDVTAGIEVKNKGTVIGTITQGVPVAVVPLPAVGPFTAGTQDIKVPKKGALALPPGDYREIKVLQQATLTLTSGVYNLKQIEMDQKSRLVINITGGTPVVLNLVEEFELGKEVKVIINNGTSQDLTINSNYTSTMTFRDGSVVQGNIIAPTARVVLGKKTAFKGAIFADDIEVLKEAYFLAHNSSIPLPKEGVEEEEGENLLANLPTTYELSQNYPNPFNPTTTIKFALPEAGRVSLKIYNIRGQLVKTLASGYYEAGYHQVQWNATSEFGDKVASGFYFYSIQAGNFHQVKKMLLVK